MRATFAAFWTPAVTGEPVAVAAVEDRAVPTRSGSVPARVYRPVAGEELPLLVYFHGGGYVKGGIAESDAFCRRLARSTRRVVVSVGYRLAPEHPAPPPPWTTRGTPRPGPSPTRASSGRPPAPSRSRARVPAATSPPRSASSRGRGGEVRSRAKCCSSPWSTSRSASRRSPCPRPNAWSRAATSPGTTASTRGRAATRATAFVSPLWAEDAAGLAAGADRRRRVRYAARRSGGLRGEAARGRGRGGVFVLPGHDPRFLQMAGVVEAAQRAIDEVAAFLDG